MKTITPNTLLRTSVALALLGSVSVASADMLAGTDVKFSGYIKADAMFSDYSEGTLASGNIGRDFYIPSLTPVSGGDEGNQFDSHIRQSRFRFTTTTDAGDGDTITGVLEFDFMATAGGNERVSNSYSPRIRHAFLKYKNWTVGQTWSTFQDVRTLPETLDFIGTADGVVFNRQTMVKYTNGAWEVALENPESTITPFGGGGRIVADDNSGPDVVARYTHKADWGHFSVAGIARQLAYDDGAGIDSTEAAYGVSLNSKISVGAKDDLKISLTTGSGLGRYVAINAANGAVLDAQGVLNAIDSTAFSIAYRHFWSDQIRSSFTYSSFSADNDVDLTGTGVTRESSSYRANLLYSPTPKLTVGGEVAFAERTNEGDMTGDMTRFQFSAKYSF